LNLIKTENVVLGEDARGSVVLDEDEDQEPCTIVITDDESEEIESEDGERDGDCPEMDSTGSEVLVPSARSSPISFTIDSYQHTHTITSQSKSL